MPQALLAAGLTLSDGQQQWRQQAYKKVASVFEKWHLQASADCRKRDVAVSARFLCEQYGSNAIGGATAGMQQGMPACILSSQAVTPVRRYRFGR